MQRALHPVARTVAVAGALSALLAVMLAALGAHAVPASPPELRSFWSTALQMHLFHSLGLLALAALGGGRPLWLGLTGGAFVAGILMFSGSLYLRAAGFDWMPGPVTPAGGLTLMSGWILAITTLVRN